MTQFQEGDSRKYLDLSKDPVLTAGVSAELEARMLNRGWEKSALKADVYAHLQFRDKTRNFYYLDGWVKAGTEVFSLQGGRRANSVFEGFEMVGGCGNVMLRYPAVAGSRE